MARGTQREEQEEREEEREEQDEREEQEDREQGFVCGAQQSAPVQSSVRGLAVVLAKVCTDPCFQWRGEGAARCLNTQSML